MSEAKVAGNSPISIELKAGQDYYWCACGRSANQPFCDGSHKGTDITPVKFNVESDVKKALCVCKQTKNPPYCDGSHNNL